MMKGVYDDLLLSAVGIAREAGKIQLEYFRGSGLDIHTKLNESDIVTVADKAAEHSVISAIRALYPTHSILSEESGSDTRDNEYLWIIDPVDGTTNFSSGLPAFAVSIAVEHRGRTVVGVVYAPYLDELFTAVAGEGAALNGRPITPKSNPLIQRAVISTGFPVDKNVNPDNNLDNFARVMPLVRGIRRLGSAALDMCYVAAGFLDAYWECNLHRWDVAAPELIVTEAGAVVDHYRDDRNESVIASSRELYPVIKPLIK